MRFVSVNFDFITVVMVRCLISASGRWLRWQELPNAVYTHNVIQYGKIFALV